MARKLRIQYPGAVYHVMNRGDRRESIFEDVGDCHLPRLGTAGGDDSTREISTVNQVWDDGTGLRGLNEPTVLRRTAWTTRGHVRTGRRTGQK
jgi:hypothetical protein